MPMQASLLARRENNLAHIHCGYVFVTEVGGEQRLANDCLLVHAILDVRDICGSQAVAPWW
jgi:hypothetical protein